MRSSFLQRNKLPIAQNVNVKVLLLSHGDLKKLDNGGYREEKGLMSIHGVQVALASILTKSTSPTDRPNVQNAVVLAS